MPTIPAAPPVAKIGADEAPEFYVNVNDDIQTLSLASIQSGLDSKTLSRDTLICPVGASEWLALSAVPHLGLRLPELSSVANVSDDDLFEEESVQQVAAAPAPAQVSPAPSMPAKKSRLSVRTKMTLGVWALSAAVSTVVILQRNGAFYAVADWMGQADGYDALEKDLIGGPGSGTVRSVEQLAEDLGLAPEKKN